MVQLQHSHQLADWHNMDATDKAEKHYNLTAQQHQFTQGQMVWLNKTNYLGHNRKLSPSWTGQHLILRTFDNGVVELMIKNRRVCVNVGRIKPVTPALTQPATQPLQDSQQPALPPRQQRPAQRAHSTATTATSVSCPRGCPSLGAVMGTNAAQTPGGPACTAVTAASPATAAPSVARCRSACPAKKGQG